MPRQVDPTQRRAELAEAVWTVIRRDGLQRASVRNVAREAGLSMGSLRHYFATQSELLCFAMQLVGDRARARVRALQPAADPRATAERIHDQLTGPGAPALTLRAAAGLTAANLDTPLEATRLHALLDGLAVHA